MNRIGKTVLAILFLIVVSALVSTPAASKEHPRGAEFGYLYVPLYQTHKVARIDLKTEKVVDAIPVGINPHDVVASLDGRLIYTVQMKRMEKNHLLVTDLVKKKQVAKIPVGEISHHLALSKDGRYLYVAADDFLVIDTRTRKVIQRLKTGKAISLSVGRGRVYVANWEDKSISVVATPQHKVIATIPIKGRPIHSALSPDGKRLYVTVLANWFSSFFLGGSGVAVLDLGKRAQVGFIKLGRDAYDVDVGPDGAIYATNRKQNWAYRIGPSSNEKKWKIKIPSAYAIAAGKRGKKVYISSQTDHAIYVLEASSGRILKKIPVRGIPQHIAFSK